MGLSSPEIVFHRNFLIRGKAPKEGHGRMIDHETMYRIFDLLYLV